MEKGEEEEADLILMFAIGQEFSKHFNILPHFVLTEVKLNHSRSSVIRCQDALGFNSCLYQLASWKTGFVICRFV